MNLLVSWFLNAIAIIITAFLLPGVHVINGFMTALWVALVLGIINAFIKPILILLTLPINILTLGLFTLVINALLIMLASSIVPGFRIDSFGWAILFAIVLSIVNSLLYRLFS